MNFVLHSLAFLLTLVLSTACSPRPGVNSSLPNLGSLSPTALVSPFTDQAFNDYLDQHGLTVSFSDAWARYGEYQTAKKMVDEHNAEADRGLHSYKLGLNHFSTDPVELRVVRNGAVVANSTKKIYADVTQLSRQTALPSWVDHRSDECLSPIKEQGSCGSCWSFSANTPVEFHLCKRTRTVNSLSEQQLVDCAPPYNGNSNGCNGGFYTNAWEYIRAAPGQTIETRYPYTARGGQPCYYSPSMGVVNVAGVKWLPANDENALKIAVAFKGPISIVVHVNEKFMLYSSGIFDDPTCPSDQPNHAMVAVGYGADATTEMDFWIIRNSWSTAWGEKGYMRIRRGVNRCGIASYPAYVDL